MSHIVESRSESAHGAPTAGSDDAAASSGAIEPPDSLESISSALSSLAVSNAQPSTTSTLDALQSRLGSSYPPPASASKLAERITHPALHSHPTTSGYSTSPSSRYGRHFTMSNSSSVDSQLIYDNCLAVPASPSMSEGLTDSPGSVSSMSSFRRGDLADIEDLDLEPELETVSECDEESSSLCSLDVGLDMDSDSERASSHGGDHEHLSSSVYALGLSSSHASRHAPHKYASQGTAASDYARRKRSEWLLNNYANKIAARRPRRVRKGRISEIVEEGGEAINTTVMPKAPSACGTSDWSCEVSGPPLAPPRSISPSDTVPAISSPLCSCVNADGATTGAPTTRLEESVETIKADEVATKPMPSALVDDAANFSLATQSDAPKLESASSLAPEPGSEPSSPPRLSRSASRRNSSPVKLRPCFRRQSSHQSVASMRESSCERDPPRGRTVRFSTRPPQEMRTHSPVEYDRKSCPVINRLSPADVEELRTMKMEMGLLEARWAAVAACKPKKVDGTEGTTKKLENHNAYNAGVAAVSASRERTPACGAESDSTLGPGSTTNPAARLRQQKERERQQERQRNMPSYLRNRPGISSTQTEPLSSEALSIRNKFGQAPPPPLPGLALARTPSASPSRSTSAPPRNRSALEDGRSPRRFSCQSMPSSGVPAPGPAEIPKLMQTSPSPPSSPPRSRANRDGPFPFGSPERGRPLLSAAPPLPSPWSSSSSSAASSIYSSTYFPAASTPAPCVSYPGSSGYDSPASEFYESGSEYDMVC